MEQYLEGWKSIQEVRIPPLETNGFRENVIVRKPVQPLPYQKKEVFIEQDNPTVLLNEMYAYEEEDKTVLLDNVVLRGYVRRVSTNEEIEITGDSFTIGKSSSCDFIVRSNATVSRRHAQIKKTKDGYYLKDLNSTNHTFVENNQIQNEVQLTDGMKFRLSDEQFEFRMEIK